MCAGRKVGASPLAVCVGLGPRGSLASPVWIAHLKPSVTSFVVSESSPRPGRGFAARFIAGCLIVTLFAASAVAATVQNEAAKITDELNKNSRVDTGGALDKVQPGKPQTLLLVGDDHRYQDPKGTPSRADTMILVRLDPDARATTMLSLPRDLLVSGGPGVPSAKLNSAYAGGPKRLISTLKTLLSTPGEPFEIQHFVSIRFTAFAKAVNTFGCFYADVDRRYFIAPNTGHAEIDQSAGYQRLCGEDSLAYVRFRLYDSDLVREARQTNYLAEARSQLAGSTIFDKRGELLRAISRYIKTDIQSSRGLLGVAKLAVDVAGHPTQRVTLKVADAADGSSVVTTPDALARAARTFLHPGSVPGARHRASRDRGETRTKGRAVRKRKARTPPSLIVADDAARQVVAGTIASKVKGLRIYYPRLALRAGRYDATSSRGYDLQSPSGETFPWMAYRLVVALNASAGQYYGVQGTTWRDPPILKLADDEERLGGRKFLVQYDGKKIRRLILRAPSGTYWVANTLSNQLTNAEMRAVAKSLTPYSG